MAVFVITAAALLCYLPAISASPDDPIHIGCFSTNFVKNHEYYNIRYAVSWEESISFCNHRLTVYMGIQKENSSSKYNFVYCGNDIKQHSNPVNSSLCRPCVHNTDRFCGGDSTLSLYQLRDTSPLTYLLLYSNMILMAKDGHTNITLVSGQSKMNAVDFLFVEDDIFFLNGTSINRLFFNYFSMKYFKTPFELWGQSSFISDLSVDWVNRKIFCTDRNKSSIWQIDLEDNSRKIVLIHPYKIHQLAIDPYYGLIFYMQADVDLFSYSLKTNTVKKYVKTGLLRMTSVKRVAISVRQERIFVIGSMDETQTMHLISADYDATKVKHLYSGSELDDPRGLDIFYDQVVWLSLRNSTRLHLYTCRLTPKCDPVDVTLINHYPTTLLDMRTYFPEKQTPSERYLCAQMRCSHSCRAASLFTAKCQCPGDMVIGKDNRTCLDDTLNKHPVSLDNFGNEGSNQGTPVEDNILLNEAQHMSSEGDTRLFYLYVSVVTLLLAVILLLFGAVFCLQSKRALRSEQCRFPRQIVKYVKSPAQEGENINIYDELHYTGGQ